MTFEASYFLSERSSFLIAYYSGGEKRLGVQRFWVQGFRGSEVQRFRGSEVQRFWVQGFRVQRFRGSGFRGSEALGSGVQRFWVQGFKGSRVQRRRRPKNGRSNRKRGCIDT